MKIAFRTFLTTLKRYKAASVLNVVGLTAAFLAFYVIMAQVRYDVTFNHSIKDNERVYLTAESREMVNGRMTTLGSGQLTTERVIAQCPDIEISGILQRPNIIDNDRGVWVKRDEYDYDKFPQTIAEISLSTLDIMGFKTVEGDLTQIDNPGNIIISQSAAELMGVGVGDVIFDDESSMYKRSKPVNPYNIVGIYKDFSTNTMMRDVNVVRKYVDNPNKVYPTSQGPSLLYVVKLYENSTPERFIQMWNDDYHKWLEDSPNSIITNNLEYFQSTRMELTSLRDMYYKNMMFKHGNEGQKPLMTQILIVLALLIISIAFINYFNFFMAMIPIRLRAVNISKVFGATKAQLRRNMLFESVAMSLLSFGLALYLMIALQEVQIFKQYLSCSLALSDNLQTIWWIVAFTVFIAIISSLYPAWYVTSFNPALGVKGGFAGSRKGRRLRIVLVGIQFVISITLIIFTVSSWVDYIKINTFEYKVPVENTITFQPNNAWIGKVGEGVKRERFYILLEELQRNSRFTDITFADDDLLWGQTAFKFEGSDEDVNVGGGPVYYNFLDFVDVPVVEGRNFSEATLAGRGEWIISRSMQREFSLNIGDVLKDRYRHSGVIVGIIDDVELRSDNPKPYIALYATGNRNVPHFLVKCVPGVSVADAEKEINDIMQRINPDVAEVKVKSIENAISVWGSYQRVMAIFSTILSLIAIVIALMGVAGIIMFEMQFRRREIALRKVFGATNLGVIWMFNRQYLLTIIVCFIISVPIAKLWVDNNVIKSDVGITWWMCAIAFLLVVTITLSLVSYRSWFAANENPADVVKSE